MQVVPGDPIRAGAAGYACWLVAAGRATDALAMSLALAAALAVRPAGFPVRADFLITLLLATAQAGATFGLTERTSWWDSLAHASVAAALTSALTLRRKQPLLGARAAGAVIALGVAWELLEATLDDIAGTDFSPSLADTMTDVAMDIAGAAVAYLFLRRRAGTEESRMRHRR